MSSSVIIDWQQLAAEERDRCLRLQQEFVETRAYARRLSRRSAVTQAVTGVRIAVPLVVTPGIDEGSTALADQLAQVRARLAEVEEQLDTSAATFARERAAARPSRRTSAHRAAAPTTSASGELAAWRAREAGRERDEAGAAAERARATAAERTAAATLTRAAELARALPDRAEEVHTAARAVLAGVPGAQESFAELTATAREATRAALTHEEATQLRERIALVTDRVAAARHAGARSYADALRERTDTCEDDPARLTGVMQLAQEVLGRLTAAESRDELVSAVHEAMGEVWSLSGAPGSGTAAHNEGTVLVPLPDMFPHHAVRFDLDDADSLTAEVIRMPGGDTAADLAAQEHLCAGMDELTARLAARGFAAHWRERSPAGAFAARTTTTEETSDGTAEERARQEQAEAAAISRARAAARPAAAQRTDPARGGK